MQYKSYIISFDIDGTLLNDNKQVSQTDLETLHALKKPNILRIAATGRNCYSVQKILSPKFPVDYVVFSSGAGIIEWASKKIIYSKHIAKADIERIIEVIKPYHLNFTINLPIPNNHNMLLFDSHADSEDLKAYASFYSGFVNPLNLNQLPEMATQIIVLLNSHVALFHIFQKQLLPLKTILTTSPINHKSMWMEVFNPTVSKSNGIEWIVNHLKITEPHVFAIGNDYNDFDLLNFADTSFVVSNAPQELQNNYCVTKSNNESGFTEAIRTLNI